MSGKIELLAPAGDLQRLKTAVDYGADAVFIGGKKYSLRSRASNFDLASIEEAVKYAHAKNVRVHVTVNMIFHDEDYEGLDEYLIALDNIGVDAIIVASMYVIQRAKALTKHLEVHVSTQYSITNSMTIDYFKALGADRVVLARETSLDELKEIVKMSSLPVEVFIHGGMCVNYSGRCTLSNYMTLRDANRGGCAQSCRWKYEILSDDRSTILSDLNTDFSMSSKDLNAIEVLKDLMDLGVVSLKIEGRMKTEYYIATVVRAYRQAIDDLMLGKDRKLVQQAAYHELDFVANRETFSGFYLNMPKASGHLYGVNGSGVNQTFVASVIEMVDEHHALIEVRNQMNQDDQIQIFGPHNSITFNLKEMVNSEQMMVTRFNKPMEQVVISVPAKVYPQDFVRKIG